MEPENEQELRKLWENVDRITAEVREICEIVKKRNKSLYKLIMLLIWTRYGFSFYYTSTETLYESPFYYYDIKKYLPKKGKKGDIPLKFVMEYLKVSHRTAQDYVRTVKALDKLFGLKILARLH